MQRNLYDDIRANTESVRVDMDYNRDRVVRLSDRVDALELAQEVKKEKYGKVPYNSGSHYNTEA